MTRKSPPDWISTTVGEACSIRNDLRLPISREERVTMDGPYPYYGPTGQLDAIADFRIDGTFALIGEDGDHFLDVEKKQQTILVAGKFNVNNHAHVIESTDLCGSEWFYNYFRHRSLKPFLTRQGAGRYKLNKAALQALPIVLPTPQEQAALNALFREWATAIQKTEQLISATEKRFKVLRERLVASPRKNVSALTTGKRQTMRFGDIFALSKEVAKAGTNLEVLSVTTSGIVRQSEYFNKQVASEDKSGYLIVRRGQLVMSGLNFWMGSIDFQTICDVGIVSPAYKVFSIVGAGLDVDYFRHYVRSSEMRKFLAMSSVQGASIVRRNLDMDQLKDSSISIPHVEKQRAIAAALNAMEQELELLREQCAALKTQKRGLMQKLLTGQWRLPVQVEAN
jgi:type I restriction enzyme S subunit